MNNISRRTYIGALIGAAMFGTARSALAKWAFGYRADGFTDAEKAVIHKALSYTMLMQYDEIINNYKHLHRGSYNLDEGVWDKSNLENGGVEYWKKKENLLEYQLRCLGMQDVKGPDLIISPYYREDTSWGQADLATISIITNDGHWTVEGRFEVQLNQYLLATGGRFDDPITWGGVIAHEMLHNLGHSHEKGEYNDGNAITLFENCLNGRGNYDGNGHRRIDWQCGGRATKK